MTVQSNKFEFSVEHQAIAVGVAQCARQSSSETMNEGIRGTF